MSDPPNAPDWATVQEIHVIHNQGGKLDQADISVSKDGITIRRQYLMLDGTTRVIKNTYSSVDDLDCKADMFMLDCDQ